MLLENAPCAECMDKGLGFLLNHKNIIATAYWTLLLKPSFLISQGHPCWHTFHALMSAKNKRPIKCVKPKLTPLFFHSSHARYAWLLYYKIQQLFWECVIMHECNNNFVFPSYSSIYTAFLNIHCFFFPLVYMQSTGFPHSIEAVHLSNTENSCNAVDRPDIKPYCFTVNSLLIFMWYARWFRTIVFITLHAMEVRLTGR